ncbi:hypothetical protein JG687_00015339 [Phytophthora cactorum]|uniref:Uncharacterized protein n=1 Tax=Phytophthora cactorum TaxID=29920 RepID=A0A8T1TZ37_9STRA|nr:hypothetical protein JG687_00015339 [Phytophthora cactorum]
MGDAYPPTQSSSIFNSPYFANTSGALTIAVGDLRYVKQGSTANLSGLYVSGNVDCGSLSIGGSSSIGIYTYRDASNSGSTKYHFRGNS